MERTFGHPEEFQEILKASRPKVSNERRRPRRGGRPLSGAGAGDRLARGTEGGQRQTSSIWGTFGRFVWASTSALAGSPSSRLDRTKKRRCVSNAPSDGACPTSLAGAMLVECRHRCRDDRRSLAAERAVAVRVLQDNRRGESE